MREEVKGEIRRRASLAVCGILLIHLMSVEIHQSPLSGTWRLESSPFHKRGLWSGFNPRRCRIRVCHCRKHLRSKREIYAAYRQVGIRS